jgi:hypothetical protein
MRAAGEPTRMRRLALTAGLVAALAQLAHAQGPVAEWSLDDAVDRLPCSDPAAQLTRLPTTRSGGGHALRARLRVAFRTWLKATSL